MSSIIPPSIGTRVVAQERDVSAAAAAEVAAPRFTSGGPVTTNEAVDATPGAAGEGARLGAEYLNLSNVEAFRREVYKMTLAQLEATTGMSLVELTDSPGFGRLAVGASDINAEDIDRAVEALVADARERDPSLTPRDVVRVRASTRATISSAVAQAQSAQSQLSAASRARREVQRKIDELNEGAAEVAQQSLATAQQFAREHGIDLDVELVVSDEPGSSTYSRSRDLITISIDRSTGVHKALANDNVFHEFGHAVVYSQIALSTSGESGAVSESLADTFAAMIDTDDWRITEDAVPGGIRDMSGESGDDPTHVSEVKSEMGAHELAGVPNRAAYLIGEALGRSVMADIYMHTIKHNLAADTSIAQLAGATIASAQELYGNDSAEVAAVRAAWTSVGLSEKMIASGNSLSG